MHVDEELLNIYLQANNQVTNQQKPTELDGNLISMQSSWLIL